MSKSVNAYNCRSGAAAHEQRIASGERGLEVSAEEKRRHRAAMLLMTFLAARRATITTVYRLHGER